MSNVIIYNPSDTTVANRVVYYLQSVNTPDYESNPNAIINPDLSGVIGVNPRFWKVSDSTVVEMSSSDKSAMLPGIKLAHKEYLRAQGHALILNRYPEGQQNAAISQYSDAITIRPNRKNFYQSFINWVGKVESNVYDKIQLVDDQTSIEAVESIKLDEDYLISQDPNVKVDEGMGVSDDTSLHNFLNENAVVTDQYTGISGPYYLMEILNHRRDLYNDSTNPLYVESHTPILGNNGILVDHATRVLNLEAIHGKLGWHRQEIMNTSYRRPKDLLIYYGWLNSFNSAQNQWNNEKVAQDMAKYNLLVFGDGVQNPAHGDYANTQVIIPRIKSLNPLARIFGYVTAHQSINDFKVKVDQWDTLGVHGIFMDEAGYDFGITRTEFNERVDYVKSKENSNIAFVNSWNPSHVLGTANDPSYPNSVYNDTSAESNLTSDDWILLESFPINTLSYTEGYESKSDWASRGITFVGLRNTYGVNFSSANVIGNDRTDGSSLSNFAFISSMMWSLDGYGTSDTYYGASSAAVKYWPRPDVANMGQVWSVSPSVQVDSNDADVYHRYVEHGRFSIDFSAGDQTATITKW